MLVRFLSVDELFPPLFAAFNCCSVNDAHMKKKHIQQCSESNEISHAAFSYKFYVAVIVCPPLIILLTRCFLFWGNTQQNCVSFDSKLFTTKNRIKTCFGQQSMQQIKALFSIRWCKRSMRNVHMKLLALDMARMHLKRLYHQFISNSAIACCVLSVLYIFLKWLFRFILKSNAFWRNWKHFCECVHF